MLIFMLSIILGATNSSRSTFLMEFKRGIVSSELLVTSAIAELEQSGFHRTEKKDAHELQFGNSAIWVRVASPTDGQLELSFSQLRGGCGNNPAVSGASELAAKIRMALGAKFGASKLTETNEANSTGRDLKSLPASARRAQ